MAQLKDDCFAFGGKLMPLADALATLQDRLSCVVDRETTNLSGAGGRYLAEDLVSSINVPPHDNSAVDGYAVAFDDLAVDVETSLSVRGRAAAGHPLSEPFQRGTAVRIFTGASMPTGCDTVFMQEDCSLEGSTVVLPQGLKQGANRRKAGEDVAVGAVVIPRGRRLRPQEIAAAAAIGCSRVAVYRPLRVAVFSTGDEIFEPGEIVPPGGICDANRHALLALLAELGALTTDLGIVRDDLDAVRETLTTAAVGNDLVVSSAGMSVGDEDHVKQAVETLGSLHFWQLAVKPGRPIGLGQVSGVPFVGLPGNPVAMMVTFMRIVRPMVRILSGGTELHPALFKVRADFKARKKAGRREWVRASLAADSDGVLVARKFPRDGAGIVSSMVDADGLVELAEDVTGVAPGDSVDFLPFSEVSR